MLNFLFRKKALMLRIYPDGIGAGSFEKYSALLDRLPESMEQEINKASLCKRLINPAECNPKCIMGYDFYIRKNHYQKCRYQCFQFAVNPGSMAVLQELIDTERTMRN
jgi:hypothetical protein